MRIRTYDDSVTYLINKYGTVNILSADVRNSLTFKGTSGKYFPRFIVDNFIAQEPAFMQALYKAGYRDRSSVPDEPVLLAADEEVRSRLMYLIRANSSRSSKAPRDIINNYAKQGFIARDLFALIKELDATSYIPYSLISDSVEDIVSHIVGISPWLQTTDNPYFTSKLSKDGTSLLLGSTHTIHSNIKVLQEIEHNSPKARAVLRALCSHLGVDSLDLIQAKGTAPKDIMSRYTEEAIQSARGYTGYLDKRPSTNFTDRDYPIDLSTIKTLVNKPISKYIDPRIHLKDITGSVQNKPLLDSIFKSDYWVDGMSANEDILNYVLRLQLRNLFVNGSYDLYSTNPDYLYLVASTILEERGNALDLVYTGYHRVLFGRYTVLGCIINVALEDAEANTKLFELIRSAYWDNATIEMVRGRASGVGYRLDITNEGDRALASVIVKFYSQDIDPRILPVTEEVYHELKKFEFIYTNDYRMSFTGLYAKYEEAGLLDLADHYILELGTLPIIDNAGDLRYIHVPEDRVNKVKEAHGYTCAPRQAYKARGVTREDIPPLRVPPKLDSLLPNSVIGTEAYRHMQALMSYHVTRGKANRPSQVNLGTKSCLSLGVEDLLHAKKSLTAHNGLDIAKLYCLYALVNVGVHWAISEFLYNKHIFERQGIVNPSSPGYRKYLQSLRREISK